MNSALILSYQLKMKYLIIKYLETLINSLFSVFHPRFRSRRVNCENEVLIRTSVGSYRFEGISREFTRKLYDWEKYRGISPRSSTFRLLGPSYTPLIEDLDETTLTEPPNATGKIRQAYVCM